MRVSLELINVTTSVLLIVAITFLAYYLLEAQSRLAAHAVRLAMSAFEGEAELLFSI